MNYPEEQELLTLVRDIQKKVDFINIVSIYCCGTCLGVIIGIIHHIIK